MAKKSKSKSKKAEEKSKSKSKKTEEKPTTEAASEAQSTPPAEVEAAIPDEASVEEVCNLFAILANGTRMKILTAIDAAGEGGISVSAIADGVGVSVSAVSQHLVKMRWHNLVSGERDKQTIRYALAGSSFWEKIKASGVLP